MNRITLVLDSSASMYHCRKAMVENVKEMLNTIRSNAEQYKEKTRVSLVDFNTRVTTIFSEVDSSKLNQKAYMNFEYNTAGGTALFDAVGKAVEEMPESESHVLIVFTDGEENSSLRYKAADIIRLIKEKQKEGNWTFAFNVPPGYKKNFMAFGIPADNIREWESHNAQSVEQTKTSTLQGVKTFYQAKSRGLNAVSNFYETDLTNLTRKEVRQDLDNLSKDYEQIQVNKVGQIRDVVEADGYEYKKGKAFYELVKPELVQETKEILVMEKGKNAIWGGQEARDLIGIPSGRVKVVPGNHANFRVFVQSTSVNRKTVPGTTILLKN